MGLRLRKSARLAPGLRLNFSMSGVSLTAGPRGGSVGIGRRGTYLNTGIPGTGLYARERIDRPSQGTTRRPAEASTARSTTTLQIVVSVDDEGVISFRDEQGNPLDEKLINTAKKQQGERIRGLIQAKCDEINARTEALGEIHLHTPSCHEPLAVEELSFDRAAPSRPDMKKPGFLAKLFKSLAAKVDAKNRAAAAAYEQARTEWEGLKSAFDVEQSRRRILIEKVKSGAETAMEIFLEQRLQEIAWPQETNVSFEISGNGTQAALDVDLPEIEAMPRRVAVVPQRGYRLSVKEMSAVQVQKLYMNHVHGIGFRLIGETFAVLPTVGELVVSGYSQRPDKASGRIGDEYLYSVRVTRPEWERIDFGNLTAIDVVDALNRFELRRDMTKAGLFRPIRALVINE